MPGRAKSTIRMRPAALAARSSPRDPKSLARHKPEALARERRNGGIVSLQATKPHAHWTTPRGRPRNGALPRLRFGLVLRQRWILGGQTTSPDDSPPRDPKSLARHKPEALARERRNGGIVSLQATKPHAHWMTPRGRPRNGAFPRLRFGLVLRQRWILEWSNHLARRFAAPTTASRSQIFGATRTRSVSEGAPQRRHRLAAGGKAACTLNDAARPTPQRSVPSLTLRTSVASTLDFGRSNHLARRFAAPPPPHDPKSLARHKPEALARERRNGGIVSLQAAKPHAH
jgi:hypothetical protein